MGGTNPFRIPDSDDRLDGRRDRRGGSTSEDDPPLCGLPPRELNTLYLGRDAQGVGLGSRLLGAAIGDDAAHLLVFEVNERAQRFSERHGFTPVGEKLLDPGTGLTERQWVRPARVVDRRGALGS
ncbi:GNAT family N-acetyltransferase [Microbacterium sp. BH-3-3-3]|uniref:GNAT family N-acetyltransferase n=1 Tax=Microbacterium sp. BH-3-3-3 TaxID=1906742 RepID=UPI0037C79D53